MGSETYHEPLELLSPFAKNLHRGIVSLVEELEAIDWYQQRAEATDDAELRAVLVHNRDEEIEHAMMTLEWLRRRFPELDVRLRTYVLQEGPITELEERAMGRGGAAQSGSSEPVLGSESLGIGGLRALAAPPAAEQE
jgi:hypothetical protein